MVQTRRRTRRSTAGGETGKEKASRSRRNTEHSEEREEPPTAVRDEAESGASEEGTSSPSSRGRAPSERAEPSSDRGDESSEDDLEAVLLAEIRRTAPSLPSAAKRTVSDDEVKRLVAADKSPSLQIGRQITRSAAKAAAAAQTSSVRQALQKSILSGDFMAKHRVPANAEAERQETSRTNRTGKGWFNMESAALTPEVERDIRILRMRKHLDPKRFYRANDEEGIPKVFQVGRVVESAADFYGGRLARRERKQHYIDSLMDDSYFKSYAKRKFREIQSEREKGGKKDMRKRYRTMKKVSRQMGR